MDGETKILSLVLRLSFFVFCVLLVEPRQNTCAKHDPSPMRCGIWFFRSPPSPSSPSLPLPAHIYSRPVYPPASAPPPIPSSPRHNSFCLLFAEPPDRPIGRTGKDESHVPGFFSLESCTQIRGFYAFVFCRLGFLARRITLPRYHSRGSGGLFWPWWGGRTTRRQNVFFLVGRGVLI